VTPSSAAPEAPKGPRSDGAFRQPALAFISTWVRLLLLSDDRCDLLCLDLEKAEHLRASALAPDAAERAAAGAKALGDPTRLSLAAALAGTDELCVCDLAWVSGRAENLVSHHLRALRAAGLVTSRRDGKMVMYAMTERGRALLGALTSEEAPAA
jgi:DNA-binding transcriptional ArsR family regulator